MKLKFTLKKTARFLFVLFVLVTSERMEASAQCTASFTWAQTSNNVITFTNTSVGGVFINNAWSFGDTTYDYTSNPVHYYSIPGTYSVCLGISDSLSCSDSICQTVVVTGITCNLTITDISTNASCSSCTDGTAAFIVTGGASPYTYSWNTSQTTNTLNNVAPGIYNVCVTDINGCLQCANISVGSNSPGCSASFSIYPDTMVLHSYLGVNMSTGAAPISFIWSWGDGTSDTSAYPTHTYANAGIYTICLSLTDSTGCTNNYCDSMSLMRLTNSIISVTILPQSPTGIKENAKANTLSIYPNPAKDYAIVEAVPSNDKILSVIIFNSLGEIAATEGLQNNTFDVHQIPQGVYFVKLLHPDGRYSSSKMVIVR
jgi:PKD repeat protein